MDKIYKHSSIKELLGALDPSKEVYLDTETGKLGSDIRLIQIYQEHWPQVLLFEAPDVSISVLWDIVREYKLIGHNILYDFGCFKKDINQALKTPREWEDTFYLLRLVAPELNTKKGFSLDSGMEWAIGYCPYTKAGLNKKQLQMSFERIKVKDVYVEGPAGLRPLTEEQYLYGSIDVYELPKLYKKLQSKLDDFVYQLDKKTVEWILTDTRGLPVDLDKLQLLEDTDIKAIADIDKQLPQGFNCNSYIQVRKLLGTVLSSDEEALTIIQTRPKGLTDLPLRATPTNGNWAVAMLKGIDDNSIYCYTKNFGETKQIKSSSELKKLSDKNLVYYTETSYKHTEDTIKYAKLINDKRKALKRLNFVLRARTAMDDNNRIRGTFSPHAVNGRIQVDSENLSQYPRTMKSMWGHKPGNGRKLIYSDFAQVELRIICAALPEMNMYKSLKAGTDLHTFVGNNLNLSEADLAQLPAGISPRFIAKQCNFLLLYGGGISNFQRTVCKLGGVWFEDDIAKKITDNWREIFSDIKTWQEENTKSKTNMDETVSGRPYKAGTVTDLNNIRVSGTGSEIFKLWLHYIGKYITSNPEFDTYIVNRVHDSVILDVPDEPAIYKKLAHILVLAAQKAWFEIIKNAPLKDVPMPCDVAVGSNWEEIEYGKNIDYNYTLEGMYMYNKNLEEEINKL